MIWKKKILNFVKSRFTCHNDVIVSMELLNLVIGHSEASKTLWNELKESMQKQFWHCFSVEEQEKSFSLRSQINVFSLIMVSFILCDFL